MPLQRSWPCGGCTCDSDSPGSRGLRADHDAQPQSCPPGVVGGGVHDVGHRCSGRQRDHRGWSGGKCQSEGLPCGCRTAARTCRADQPHWCPYAGHLVQDLSGSDDRVCRSAGYGELVVDGQSLERMLAPLETDDVPNSQLGEALLHRITSGTGLSRLGRGSGSLGSPHPA